MLALGLALNYLAVEKVDAAYNNHLVGFKWGSTNINYDIAADLLRTKKV